MRRIGIIAALLLFAISLAFGVAPRRILSASIEIAAPPSRVWAVLMNVQDYAEWNPDMRLTGNLVPGATIENVQGHGDEQMTFRPTVLAVHPEQELRWLGHYGMAGIFDAEHYFLLRPHGAGTLFTQGEAFHGLALWFYDVRQLLPRFIALNEALKSRAERP